MLLAPTIVAAVRHSSDITVVAAAATALVLLHSSHLYLEAFVIALRRLSNDVDAVTPLVDHLELLCDDDLTKAGILVRNKLCSLGAPSLCASLIKRHEGNPKLLESCAYLLFSLATSSVESARAIAGQGLPILLSVLRRHGGAVLVEWKVCEAIAGVLLTANSPAVWSSFALHSDGILLLAAAFACYLDDSDITLIAANTFRGVVTSLRADGWAVVAAAQGVALLTEAALRHAGKSTGTAVSAAIKAVLEYGGTVSEADRAALSAALS